MPTAVALTVAGSDSGGGAGIQADLKTFSALGAYGASAITAVTAQNTRGVQAVLALPAAMVAAQVGSVLDDLPVHAAKTGMLANAAIIEAVAAAWARPGAPPLVVDPVMVATSGDALLEPDAVAAVVARLLPLALVLTPNLPEAAALLGEAVAGDEAAMARQGAALRALGCPYVLMKGGHGAGPEAVDLLVGPEGTLRLAAPRLPTRRTHGTGCTLAAALTALFARERAHGRALDGRAVEAAARGAKGYLSAALAAADRLGVGEDAGPVHHFAAWW